MNNQRATTARHSALSEVAVDGLIRGLIAGSVMLLYLVIAGLTYNESPAVLLGRFGPADQTSAASGIAAHAGMSAVYGIVFVLLLKLLGRGARTNMVLIAGIAYGILLFLVAVLVLLQVAQSPMLQIPAIHLGIAHVLYGAVLGYLTMRR